MINRWNLAKPIAIGLASLTVAFPYYASAADWTEKFKLKGDFRYRYEMIDEDEKDQRHRNRLRLRLGVHAKVNDNVDVGIMLASGGEDPVSTNQSLDSQASTKDLRLDQAYFAWKPASGFAIKGGKLKNPFYRPVKTTLLWDGDLRPEGLALQYDGEQVFFNAGYFFIEERSKDDDSFLMGAQVGYQGDFDGTKLTLGTGYFGYTEIEGRPVTDFGYLKAEDDSFGNSLNDDGNFITDYTEWELFGDISFKAGGVPLALFFDYVINTAADDDDTAYLVGFKVGKTKTPGSWDFRYNYRELEADAVFGAFSESDFLGGGTDGKGHQLNLGYQIAKGWKLALTYFVNEKGLDNGKDYNRLQADLKFKF
jgi:hypothetical protein